MLEETSLSIEDGFCLQKCLYLVFQFDSIQRETAFYALERGTG